MTPFILPCLGCGRELWHATEVAGNMWPPCAAPMCPSCGRSSMHSGPQWHEGKRKAQAFLTGLQTATRNVLERRAR